jgi:hypothetical protein
MQFTKYVLPVVVGSMAGMILISIGEIGLVALYPLPPGAEKNRELLEAAVKLMPAGAFALLLVNYIICSFLAGLIATLVAQRTTKRPAVIVGIVLTLAGLYNIIMVPHPVWFAVLNLLVYLPCAYLGYMAVRKKSVIIKA